MSDSSADASCYSSSGEQAQGFEDPPFQQADLALARAILDRNRKAMEEFVQSFSGPVFGYVHSRLAPRTELIEDVVQEVFMVAWQRMGSYRGESTLRSWLLGIARYKVEDHFRDKFRQHEEWDNELEVADTQATALDVQVDLERQAEAAWKLLHEIPERYRMILLWRYWETRSAREIAGFTGTTEKAVERLLARAREHFKKRWPHA